MNIRILLAVMGVTVSAVNSQTADQKKMAEAGENEMIRLAKKHFSSHDETGIGSFYGKFWSPELAGFESVEAYVESKKMRELVLPNLKPPVASDML